jgi:hypothetical protein
MTLKPGDFAVVPQHALALIDHADGFAFGFGNRTFLDTQFDKAREFLRTHRIATPIAKAIQRIDYGCAIGRLPTPSFVVQSGSFLIGPVDDADRQYFLEN